MTRRVTAFKARLCEFGQPNKVHSIKHVLTHLLDQDLSNPVLAKKTGLSEEAVADLVQNLESYGIMSRRGSGAFVVNTITPAARSIYLEV